MGVLPDVKASVERMRRESNQRAFEWYLSCVKQKPGIGIDNPGKSQLAQMHDELSRQTAIEYVRVGRKEVEPW